MADPNPNEALPEVLLPKAEVFPNPTRISTTHLIFSVLETL